MGVGPRIRAARLELSEEHVNLFGAVPGELLQILMNALDNRLKTVLDLLGS